MWNIVLFWKAVAGNPTAVCVISFDASASKQDDSWRERKGSTARSVTLTGTTSKSGFKGKDRQIWLYWGRVTANFADITRSFSPKEEKLRVRMCQQNFFFRTS